MKDGLIEKIKSRGYWRINLKPQFYDAANRLSLQDCQRLVEVNSVELRGWDYPHIPTRNDDESAQERSVEYHQGWVDWWNHKEFWRMYRSRQFIHYTALWEDWEDPAAWPADPRQQVGPGNMLVVQGCIYTITEIVEFARRLLNKSVFGDAVVIEISLENTRNRQLWVDPRQRMPFSFPRRTDAPSIGVKTICFRNDIAIGADEVAIPLIVDIFASFGWDNLPVESIRSDQKKLLSGML